MLSLVRLGNDLNRVTTFKRFNELLLFFLSPWLPRLLKTVFYGAPFRLNLQRGW